MSASSAYDLTFAFGGARDKMVIFSVSLCTITPDLLHLELQCPLVFLFNQCLLRLRGAHWQFHLLVNFLFICFFFLFRDHSVLYEEYKVIISCSDSVQVINSLHLQQLWFHLSKTVRMIYGETK